MNALLDAIDRLEGNSLLMDDLKQRLDTTVKRMRASIVNKNDHRFAALWSEFNVVKQRIHALAKEQTK